MGSLSCISALEVDFRKALDNKIEEAKREAFLNAVAARPELPLFEVTNLAERLGIAQSLSIADMLSACGGAAKRRLKPSLLPKYRKKSEYYLEDQIVIHLVNLRRRLTARQISMITTASEYRTKKALSYLLRNGRVERTKAGFSPARYSSNLKIAQLSNFESYGKLQVYM